MKNKFFLFLIPFVFAICLIPKNVFADTYSWSYQDSDFNLADKTKLVTTTCNNKGFSTSSLNCTNLSNNSFVIYNKKQDIYIVADNVSSSPTYSDYIPLASYSDSYGTHVGFLFNDFSVLSSDFSRVIGTSSATDKNYGVTWLNHYGLNFYEVYNSSYSTSSKINFPLVYSKLSMKTSNGISSTRDINHFAEVMFLNSYTDSTYYNFNYNVKDNSEGVLDTFTYVPFNGKKINTLVDTPFAESGFLDSSSDYASSKTYSFNSSNYSKIKIKYDILEGSVQQQVPTSNWFLSFFGVKDTKTISIDNFDYSISATNGIPVPQRFYSKDGKTYKRTPSDFSSSSISSNYVASVNSLGYNDGVRSGYILIDTTGVTADTTINVVFNYSKLSVAFSAPEYIDSDSNYTETDISNYYAVGLVPKFTDYSSAYSIYVKGHLIMASELPSLEGVASTPIAVNSGSYVKAMIDFSNIPLASDHNLYYYIKNKDYSVTNGSSAFIKYDTAFFDLVTFSSLDSVASLNGVTYIPFDTSKWSAGSLDSEGYAVGIGSSGAVTTSSSNDNEGNSSTNTSLADLKKFLSNASGVFALLTGGFAFIGQVFANFTSIMPTELMIVLNAILITTGVVIVVNIVKKFV